MTEEALKYGIQRLILKRKALEPFSDEVKQINIKLDKLYEIQWLMQQQKRRA